MSEKTQDMSKSISELAKHGIANAAGGPDCLGMAFKQVTQVGASPFTVVFATVGLPDMADTSYGVFLGGEDTAVGAAYCAHAGRTTKQCVITGGTNGHVHDVHVVGRLATMPDPLTGL